MNKYESIINLPRHISKKHPQMDRVERAAQFAPFAALVGFGDEIKEANRLTEKQLFYDENYIQEINSLLVKIVQNIKLSPKIHVKYYVPDLFKEGGSFEDYIGQVKLVDEVNKKIIFIDGYDVDISFLSFIEFVEDIK